jgi:histidine triad (HIT) family protein
VIVDPECIFCGIVAGTLVVPRAHSRDLLEIAGRAKDRLGADGVNLLNCCGADAWQSVFHFHFHVIPRFEDRPDLDAVRLPWDPVPGDLDEIRRIGRELA